MKARYNFLFARRGKDPNGFGSVELQVYMSREHRQIVRTGIRLHESQWDERSGMPYSITDEGRKYNRILMALRRKIEDYEMDLMMQGDALRPWLVRELLNDNRPRSSVTLVDFIQVQINQDMRMTPGTRRSHIQTLAKLKAHASGTTLSQVDYNFITGWDRYLIKLKLHPNTIEGHHRRLRKWINIAIKVGVMDHNPYKHYKLHKIPTERQALTEEELNRILAVNYSDNKRLDNVRALFLFACYTGLRYGELYDLRMRDCTMTQQGWEINICEMRKSPVPVFLPLHSLFAGRPQEIFEQWVSGNKLMVPRYANSNINIYLKQIAGDARITKPLSFHIARHTCATLLGVYGDPYLVMSILGHRNIKTSMVYVKSTPEIIRKKLARLDW